MQPFSLPLPIAEITPPGLPGAGLIGLSFAPGGRRRSALSIAPHRDLGADLDRIAAWNAAAVVTLLSDAEQQEL
ncbi:MAG TPA: hypothetical protein VGU45_16965, partial [Microvirga sp.]|nr:hypothetical protein [Microvirga sp.]